MIGYNHSYYKIVFSGAVAVVDPCILRDTAAATGLDPAVMSISIGARTNSQNAGFPVLFGYMPQCNLIFKEFVK